MRQNRSRHILRRAFGALALLVLVPLGAAGSPGADAARPAEVPDKLPDELSASDWQSIRAAYEHNRHAVRPDLEPDGEENGRYQASNPGQRIVSSFDGQGVRVTPDHGRWEWGLELAAWGARGALREAAEIEATETEGSRIAYTYADGLSEWYVNRSSGLEHGFTVPQPPAGAANSLRFELRVLGDLAPQVAEDGQGAAFVNAAGLAELNYGGLKVWDADGKMLPAEMETADGRLALNVETTGASYPITVDPLVQQAYLKASNTGAGDTFGESVAVSGDTVVVGAPFEDSDAAGVNNDGDNDDATQAGAAYVFVRDGITWSQQAYLKASNTDVVDRFGFTVAVSGDTVVVGARLEDSDATGVNDDEGNNDATNAGAAYVFGRDGTTWSQQAYLKASNTDADDEFGDSVAVSGDTVVVGAPFEGSDAKGVNGADNNDAFGAGAAYVFGLPRTVGGNVSGLEGSGLVLQNNGGDDLAISADGGFTFSPQDDGTNYEISVATQPSDPSQTCTVTNGSGTLSGSDVTDVEVDCVIDTFTVGGTLSGLEGDQVVLVNNGFDVAFLIANGSYTLPAQDDGSSYEVTVGIQPSDPDQTCSVSNVTGTLSGADVDDVDVTCQTDTYTVGGAVFDLAGNGLVLQNNGDDDQVITAGGGFIFSPQADGTNYDVTVLAQPSDPTQLCSVINGAGTLSGSDVTDVIVDCASAFTVGGTVSGLKLPGLVLELESGSLLLFDQDGTYSFSTGLLDGADYNVTAPLVPDDHGCSIANASGSIAGADVVDVDVACSTDIAFADDFEILSETPVELD